MKQITQIRIISFKAYQIYMDDTKDNGISFEDYVNNVLRELFDKQRSIEAIQCMDANTIVVVYTLTI